MKWIISRFNHDMASILEYAKDYILYDRSDEPLPGSIVTPNIGSDIYDKLTFIIDNYDNLPDIAVYTKANLFKYITKEEFEQVKGNTTFTPLLTKNHQMKFGVCHYTEDGMYNEYNDYWYLNHHKAMRAQELIDFLSIRNETYLKFAPGSNYIIPKENILKHPKEYYEKLRSFLGWDRYPGEAQIIERALYKIWK